MRLALLSPLAFAALTALTGCTVGESCYDQVETTGVTELGFVRAGRCGIGHCLTFSRPSGNVFRVHFPTEPGTFTLEDLDAEICPTNGDEGCVSIAGTLVARSVHRPELGRAVGRLEADLQLAHGSLPPGVHIDYREQLVERCYDETWPDLGGSRIFGP
jgi:hypothetical protein